MKSNVSKIIGYVFEKGMATILHFKYTFSGLGKYWACRDMKHTRRLNVLFEIMGTEYRFLKTDYRFNEK